MIDSLVHAFLWAGFTVWQAISGTALLQVENAVVVQQASPTPSHIQPSPTSLPAVKALTTTAPIATPHPSTSSPLRQGFAGQAGQGPTPSPTVIVSKDCDFEYHYDSRDEKNSGDVTVEHRCQNNSNKLELKSSSTSKSDSNNTSTVKNNVDINVNTGDQRSNSDQESARSGDIKIDMSVKNNVN